MEYYGPFVIWAFFCAALSYWFVRKANNRKVEPDFEMLHGKDIDTVNKSPLPLKWFLGIDENVKFCIARYYFHGDGEVSFERVGGNSSGIFEENTQPPVKWFFYV